MVSIKLQNKIRKVFSCACQTLISKRHLLNKLSFPTSAIYKLLHYFYYEFDLHYKLYDSVQRRYFKEAVINKYVQHKTVNA